MPFCKAYDDHGDDDDDNHGDDDDENEDHANGDGAIIT